MNISQVKQISDNWQRIRPGGQRETCLVPSVPPRKKRETQSQEQEKNERELNTVVEKGKLRHSGAQIVVSPSGDVLYGTGL